MREAMTTVEKITRTINDPAASDLLRFICAKSLSRDAVDAVNDLEYAAELFAARLAELQAAPRARLRHHVTGAIERGEKTAIVEKTK